MAKNGLEADILKILRDLRIKTLQGFIHIHVCALSSDVATKRKVFKRYIEPIIAYLLISLLMTSITKKSLEEFNTLQNNFLRKIAKVRYYANSTELHVYLGFWTIEEELCRLAANLWKNLKASKNCIPNINTRKTQYGVKIIIVVKMLLIIFILVVFNTWKVQKNTGNSVNRYFNFHRNECGKEE